MPETHDVNEVYEIAEARARTEKQREYWRERQREHRIKKASLKHAAVFEPNLIRFELCSFCKKWHGTQAILADGTFLKFTLDSYHSKESVLNFVRGLQAGLPEEAGYIDHKTATELCIKDLMDTRGYAEDAAREEAKKLLLNDAYRIKLIKFHHDLARDQYFRVSKLKMCINSRMQIYHETEHYARLNCEVIMQDKSYRHFPPGLVKDPEGHYEITGPVLVPAAIDKEPWIPKDPTITALRKCFREKLQKHPDLDPAVAIQECMREVEFLEYGEPHKPAVGDLFGKSAAEIRAMSKRKPDPALTVGDLYGKTKKQILRMQRHSWDEKDNEAFEQCVIEKMKEGMTRKEAEDICEALSASSADRKLKPIDDGAGVTHIS